MCWACDSIRNPHPSQGWAETLRKSRFRRQISGMRAHFANRNHNQAHIRYIPAPEKNCWTPWGILYAYARWCRLKSSKSSSRQRSPRCGRQSCGYNRSRSRPARLQFGRPYLQDRYDWLLWRLWISTGRSVLWDRQALLSLQSYPCHRVWVLDWSELRLRLTRSSGRFGRVHSPFGGYRVINSYDTIKIYPFYCGCQETNGNFSDRSKNSWYLMGNSQSKNGAKIPPVLDWISFCNPIQIWNVIKHRVFRKNTEYFFSLFAGNKIFHFSRREKSHYFPRILWKISFIYWQLFSLVLHSSTAKR